MNIHGEQLSATLSQTHRACIDGDGNFIEGYYVAEDGSVISAKYRKLRTRRPAFSNGHLYVRLRVNGTYTVESVRQLVARSWIGPAPSPYHRIFHLDRDRKNNAASNLTWALGATDRPMIPDEEIETMRQLRGERKTFNQIASTVGRTAAVVGDVVCGRGGFEGLAIEESQIRGVRSSKLTSADVDDIRKLWGTGQFTQKEIAAVFGIDNSAVSYIVRGKRWKKVG